jgi:type II secretory pathway predicted ATPase ExeA
MNYLNNPFSPSAGTTPPELAGRDDILNKAEQALSRIKIGRYEKSFFLVGLRGVGKTVLLNKIRESSSNKGFISIFIEAHAEKSLGELLAPEFRKILLNIDTGEKVKKALRVLKSFFTSIKLKFHDIEMSLEANPEIGSADSGDLEFDLPILIEALAEAAQSKKTAIALIIDEIQYLDKKELSALIMAIHKISQKQLPLILVGAGLPQLVGLAGSSKSYAERLFDYPKIGALNDTDAKIALQEPVKEQGAFFCDKALKEIILQTRGYPYFLQEWGYNSWNLARGNEIELGDVQKATIQSIERLDESFFKVRFDRITPKEKEYLRALAELGEGPHRSGDIVSKLKTKQSNVSLIRDNLIKKGMIYSPSYGDIEFTVPLFDEFMKRMMPSDTI